MNCPPAAAAEPRAPSLREAAAAFGAVVNLRSVAALFYLTLLFVVSRFAMVLHLEPPGQWLANSVVYLRQNLISGLLVLLAIGVAEASLHGRTLAPAAAFGWRATAVFGAATASTFVRLWVFDGWPYQMIEWSWYATTIGIWTLNGGLGYALVCQADSDARSRRQLALADREREQLAARSVEARLSALQAQIEPHFLFNTLAHVQRLYETEPLRGRDMLRSLIDYLRAALPSMRRSGSCLRRELELARSFLTILQLRMGDRLAFEIRADDELLDVPVPPMVLPTLVENAIKHGLAPLPRGGRIDISARRSADGRLVIEVADDGRGFTASAGSGVGLSNTRARLAALFGERAALELEGGAAAGVVARLLLPLDGSATGVRA